MNVTKTKNKGGVSDDALRIKKLAQSANELLASGKMVEAYPALTEIATKLKTDIQSQIVAGCVAGSMGNTRDARGWFEKAIQLDPQSIEARHNLALTYSQSGELDSAIEIFEKAICDEVADAEIYHELGLIYVRKNNARAARNRLYCALRLDSTRDITRDALLESCKYNSDIRRANRYLKIWENCGVAVDRMASWRETVRQMSRSGVSEKKLIGAKIAIFATHGSFLGDIQRRLEESNSVKRFESGSLTEMRKLLDWCDLAWFEWCDQLLIQATHHLPKLCPIVCRLHSYETFTDMPQRVDWSKVNLLIFVNKSVEALTKDRLPEALKTKIIHNALDTSRFTIQKTSYGKNIASVGYINYKKNPQLLLYIMKALQEWDPEFTLHIAGENQDSRIELYMKDMARKMGVNIEYHGWVSNMTEFYRNMDFVISTSLFESFHYSIAEGMSCGLIPLVHDWFGSEEFYPDKFRFRGPDECVELIKKFMKEDRAQIGRECREHIENSFGISAQLDEVEATLAETVREAQVEDKTIDLGMVSIIIPTYNRADMLPDAISSVLAQSYPHFEIVVVDDGSTDNTQEILKQYTDRYPGKIKVITQENRGVSAALNSAIQNSSGEYISWLSSDDAYHPEKLWEDIKILAHDRSVDWVYSDFYFMSEDLKLERQAHVSPLENDTIVKQLFEGNPIHGCTVMFRKSNLEKTGMFDETLGGKISFGADGALWHKMAYYFKFAFIDKPLVYYRRHTGQVTHQADIAAHLKEYRAYMKEYFNSIDGAETIVADLQTAPGPRGSESDISLRLGINADPDFPEEKPSGQRILWIGTADPCGNAAMYARAINRYTEHLCRVVTFKDTRGFDHDIVLRRQNWAGDDGFSNELTPQEEQRLRYLADKADVLVFSACAYARMGLPDTRMDDTDQLRWGTLNWRDYSSKKPCVAFFFGSTATRANSDWYWDLYANQKGWRVATGQLDLKRRWSRASYIPTWLDIDAERYKRIIEPSERTLVVQTPTDPPIKNSKELESAVRSLAPDYPNLSLAIKSGISYTEALDLKRTAQIALDQMQINDGYYCMSSLENSALGLVNFVYVDDFGLRTIANTLESDEMPWKIVKNEDELRSGIKALLDDPAQMLELQKTTQRWIQTKWHPSRLVKYLTDAILS